MKKIFLVLLLALLMSPMTAEAQEFSALQNKVLETVRKGKPDWKLSQKGLTEKEVFYQWESESDSEKQIVRIRMFYAASRKEAEEQFKPSVSRWSVGPDRKLTGLGDEAYLWISANNGSGTVRFRKSNVFIDVSASSVALAQQLARQVADLIDK